MTWQPIETAPKDDLGHALLYDDGQFVIGEYLEGANAWYDQELRLIEAPTHWMHLPPPPETAVDIEGAAV